MGQCRQLSATAMGRLQIALLPLLALLLILVNLPASSSAPQPGADLLRRAWEFQVDLWRQAFEQVEADRRAEMRQARLSSQRGRRRRLISPRRTRLTSSATRTRARG